MNSIEHAKSILEEQRKRDLHKQIECEKCSEETGNRLVGDESVAYCKNCNWITNY